MACGRQLSLVELYFLKQNQNTKPDTSKGRGLLPALLVPSKPHPKARRWVPGMGREGPCLWWSLGPGGPGAGGEAAVGMERAASRRCTARAPGAPTPEAGLQPAPLGSGGEATVPHAVPWASSQLAARESQTPASSRLFHFQAWTAATLGPLSTLPPPPE